MTIDELQERRNTLATEIRSQADKFKGNGNSWPSQADKSRWDRLNADYDKVVGQMDAERDAGVLDRAAAVDRLQSSVANNPFRGGVMPGREDTHPRRQDVAGGMIFRDSTGRQIQALSHGQPVMPDSVAKRDDPAMAGVDIGDVLVSMMSGRPRNLDRQQYQAAIGGVDTAGGFILNPTLSGRMIDLVRDAAVVTRAGGQTIPMDSREMSLASITSDPTPHWRAEEVHTPASSMTFGRITLRARTLAAVVPVSLELLEDASNAGRIIADALQAAMAVELDRAALMGEGKDQEPTGIRHTTGITSQSAVGTPSDYSDVTAAVGSILKAKYPGDPSSLAWVHHPRDGETYDGLTDTTGQPLQPTPWAAAVQRYATTALPTDEGGSNNESIGIMGAFDQVVIGMRTTGINIRVATDGTATDSNGVDYNAGAGLMRHIVAYMRADVAVLRPSWFTLMSGVTAA